MFIAAKYEEILAPSVDEFVFMTENGYTREEILKGERIVLQTLDFGNPNPTHQAASNAAADPTTPNAKSAEPREPAGAPRKPQNVLYKSVGSSARGETQEADEEDPQSVSLEGEQGHELSDEAGPNPRPSKRVDSTSGQAAQAKWQVEGHARVEKMKDRIEGPEDKGQQVNQGGGKEVKNENEEDSPSAPSTKPPSPSTSNQAPRPQGHR
ncbi:hypothetical protein BU15DRAFT_80942 [Melanogaster broomeanus]|nr:hypothetical protein BU15DRAFT_80942 [Melanogaster broomeanus]